VYCTDNPRQLLKKAANGKLIATDFRTVGGAPEIGVPHVLFETRISTPGSQGAHYSYSVTQDGRRFLITTIAEGTKAAKTPLTVVLNWTASLRK